MIIYPKCLNDVENQKAQLFETRHYGCTISYTFVPTGIGTGIYMWCAEHEVKEDISDYDSW